MRHAHGGSDTLAPTAVPRPGELNRSGSQTESLYSSYSYYPYDGSPVPSPTHTLSSPPAAGPSQPSAANTPLQPQLQTRPRAPSQARSTKSARSSKSKAEEQPKEPQTA